MALFRREVDIPIVAASAAQVRLAEENDLEPSKRALRVGTALGWQIEAWRWYNTLGVVWYSHAWKGNAIGGLDWLIGIEQEGSGDVVPVRGVDGRLAAGADDLLAELAEDALRRLVGLNGSHGEWARPLGTSMSCVAEGWLVGYHVNEDGDPVPGMIGEGDTAIENEEAIALVWDACSPTELGKVDGDGGKKVLTIRRTIDGEPTKLPPDAVAVRIWRRHPRFADDPDGAMEALNEVCEDLYILRMAVRGSALSRTHAGLLLIPTEGLGQPLSAYANQATAGGTGAAGAGPPPNPVVTELIAGLSTPHKDPGSAAALVPTTMTTKSDHIEKWRHIDLGRDLDPEQREQRTELIRSYATGVDLPPERLLGMADLNHWTAWQVGEDAWRHVDPDARCVADGVTSGYLWPDMLGALEDRGVEITAEIRQRVRAYRVMYDPTAVITSPDRSDDADEAFDRGAISWPAYRRYKHFPETDAPTPEELEERALYGFSGSSSAPGSAPPAGEPGPAQSAQPGDTAAQAAARAFAIHERRSVRASLGITGTMERYGRACARIETTFLATVLLAVDAAVDEAVRKAQARLRSRVSRDPELRALRAQVRGCRNHELAGLLGPREVRRIMATFQEEDPAGIFEGALALLLARYAELAAAAHAEWRQTVSEMLEVEFTDEELAMMEADLTASAGVLETGARQAAEAALIGGVAAAVLLDGSGPGEVPAGVRIPPTVVRRAAARAGGAPVSGGVAPLETGWEGGLTTGPTIDQFLSRHGFTPAGLVWNYGAISSRRQPYLPHVELGGIEAADLAGYFGFYPGDHGGCQCALGRLYVNEATGDTAEVESLDPSELP